MQSGVNIAKVVIVADTRAVDMLYSYIIPAHIELCIGMRIIVPFGRGNISTEAIVVDIGQATEAESNKLKSVFRRVDPIPLCTPALLKLALWIRERYLCTYYQAMKLVLPAGIRISTIVRFSLKPEVDITSFELNSAERRTLWAITNGAKNLDDIASERGAKKAVYSLRDKGILDVNEVFAQRASERSVKRARLTVSEGQAVEIAKSLKEKHKVQAEVLEWILSGRDNMVATIIKRHNGGRSALNSLIKKEIVTVAYEPFSRVSQRDLPEATSRFELTQQQSEVVSGLKQLLNSGKPETALLRGVTGSGKTEVYLQIIEHIIAQGKQAICLVPEISLTPQTVQRFKGRFDERVSVLHSGLSLGERYDEWKRVLSGAVCVAVGARSAIFAPFSNLGVIIIDEEHETTYKSEVTPHYHARAVAAFRSMSENALLILGSATPSIDSYYRAKQGNIALFEMTKRYNENVMPRVEIADMREELADGNHSMFSRRLIELINNALAKNEQIILFLNRRGFNSFVFCRSCGEPIKCEHCAISLTYHKRTESLNCHFCGYSRANVTVCPNCASKHIRYIGAGTQKVEEELSLLFPGAKYIRMDADTTARKNAHGELLSLFAERKVDILLGTQMVAKGLDFPNCTVVGVMLADQSLNNDDFRAAERTFALLTQVAGRAGRGLSAGRGIIQTYNPQHYAVCFAQKHDYPAFYSNEIALRRQLFYPPFCDIINVVAVGKSESAVSCALLEAIEYLKKNLPPQIKRISLIEPRPAPYAKISDNYRFRSLIKTTETKLLLPILRKMMVMFSINDIYITIDVNPHNLN